MPKYLIDLEGINDKAHSIKGDIFFILQALNHQTFVSVNDMALLIDKSLGDIYAMLNTAAQYGVYIEYKEGSGYRLIQAIDWLNKETVNAHLGAFASHYALTVVSATDSTNTDLLDHPAACHRQVLATEWQYQGRGRRGKTWQASIGSSLMFSLKWIFPKSMMQLSGLSLAVGVAILRSLYALNIKEAGLKWPNDLICRQGKLGGVLVEVGQHTAKRSEVVIGIGLNTSPLAAALSVENYSHLQTLGYTGGRNRLFAVLLLHLNDVLSQFEKEGFSPFVTEWENAHVWQNKTVNVLEGPTLLMSGQALGITEKGTLRLSVDGAAVELMSGDISLRIDE